MSKTLCLFLSVLFWSGILAGNIKVGEYQDKYPDADAVTLKHRVSVRYFFDKEGELHAKSSHTFEILALSKDASELDLIQVPYSSFEKLTLKSARYFTTDSIGKLTLQENVKVRHAEVKDYYINNIFYNDLKVKQFAPAERILPGSVLRYSYDVEYLDLKFLNRISPQLGNEIVEKFELQLSFPKNVSIDVSEFNFDKLNLELNQSETKEMGTWKYSIEALMPIAYYNYSPPLSYLKPHFVIVTKGYQQKKNYIPLMDSTDDLYAWYNSLISQLNSSSPYIKYLVNEICDGKSTDEEKIEAIYKWIQDNITYVAFEDGIAGFKPAEG